MNLDNWGRDVVEADAWFC